MIYKFCPVCGNRLLVKRNKNKGHRLCAACGISWYHNSKPCVGVLILDRNRVLLVKRAISPYKGFWDIPGGFIEAGEYPPVAAIREIKEETGLQIKLIEMLDFFLDTYGPDHESTLNICYIANISGGKAQIGSDAKEMCWFALDSLPRKIAFKWSQRALKQLKRKLR